MRTNVSARQRPTSADGEVGRPEVPAPGVADPRVRSEVTHLLQAFGDQPGHVSRQVDALMASAASRCQLEAELSFAEAALGEAESELEDWALFVLGPERVGAGSATLVARAAYRACGGGARWPSVLLEYDLPAGFVEAMREAAPPPTPPERPGRMAVQPLDSWSWRSVDAVGLVNRLISAFGQTSRV